MIKVEVMKLNVKNDGGIYYESPDGYSRLLLTPEEYNDLKQPEELDVHIYKRKLK